MQFAFPFHRLANYTLIVSCLFVISSSLAAQKTDKPPREQIGVCLGKPVYRDQIRTGKYITLQTELLRLFASPATEKYFEAHESEIVPTEAEIAFTANYYSKDSEITELSQNEASYARGQLVLIQQQLASTTLTEEKRKQLELERTEFQAELKMPGRSFARFLLDNLKFQRHLYDNFGGGRILWQQAGQEAFDAMHHWLKDLEKKGEFRIDDPKLREVFYEYWTTDHSFLTSNPERIREEFLEPEWAPDLSAHQPLTAKKP
ncbi:hypothetical protein [Gimesia sp.]|uniref:hypothetical protein n=1 Tax=Gimesia sp. TaxID=2024833 RepID=UPI003A920ABA